MYRHTVYVCIGKYREHGVNHLFYVYLHMLWEKLMEMALRFINMFCSRSVNIYTPDSWALLALHASEKDINKLLVTYNTARW